MNVTKKGQKFLFQNKTYTAQSFFGESGIEYDTLEEAKKNNPNNSMILVKNEEYKSTCIAEETTVIN